MIIGRIRSSLLRYRIVAIGLAMLVGSTMQAGGKILKEKEVEKLPIVYGDDYNISFYGLQRILHSFDSEKYGKVHGRLKELGIKPEQFHKPEMVSDVDLLKVHTAEYLASLNNSATIAKITEVPLLSYMPNVLVRWKVLNPMKYATQGTVDAVDLAQKSGWAINLSGGYHHAKKGNGEGFCVYADISLAIKKNPNMKVMIVDLDAHQGNGCSTYVKDGDLPGVVIFDVHNKNVYPNGHDKKAQVGVAYNHPITFHTTDEEYLALVKNALGKAIKHEKPDLIIYNAGTDPLSGDPVGGLNISKEGLIERDALVYNHALSHKIPIVQVLSGGYTQESHGVISASIENIFKNVMPKYGINPLGIKVGDEKRAC
jgi:histone deacetylase 11